jgi:hypothetical protein
MNWGLFDDTNLLITAHPCIQLREITPIIPSRGYFLRFRLGIIGASPPLREVSAFCGRRVKLPETTKLPY